MARSRRARRRLAVVSGLIILAVAGVAAVKLLHRTQQGRMLDRARAGGLAAYAEGDHQATLDELKYYLQHVKDDVEVLLAFADARARTPLADGHHIVEALGLYREALRLMEQRDGGDRREDAALRRLADLYGMVGMRFEQVKTADRILRTRPDDVEALSARAIARFADRQFEPALEDAERLVELDPLTLRWRQLQLEILRAQGRPEQEILAVCRSWKHAAPEDIRFQMLEAGLLASAGRLDEARRLMADVAASGAGALEPLQTMVALLDELDLSEMARRAIDDARAKFPDEQWVRQAIVRRHWQAGALDAARDELARAERDFQSLEPGLLELKALVLAVTDGPDAARPVLRRLRESAGADEAGRAWARAVEARQDLGEGRWREALEVIAQAIRLRPTDPVLHLVQGETYLKMGESAQALDAFAMAFRLDPNWVAAGTGYAGALLAVERAEDAYAVARHALRRADRSSLQPYVTYARTFLAVLEAGGNAVFHDAMLDHGGSVVAVFEGIAEQVPHEPVVASLLAEAYVRTGHEHEAVSFMTGAARAPEPSTGVLLALARVSLAHGLGVEADLLMRAREIDGDTIPVAFALARMHAATGRHERGLELIDGAIAASVPAEAGSRVTRQGRVAYLLDMDHPGGPEALRRYSEDFEESASAQLFVLGAAAAWTDRDLVASAIDRLEGQLGAHAQKVRLARARCAMRFHAGDERRLAEAIMMLGEVLDESPGSLAALTFMAQASMLGEHPSPERAIEHLERAVNAYPRQLQLYPPLITWLQRRGDFEKAEMYLERMGRLPAGPERYRRAELQLLRQQGDFESALVKASGLIDAGSTESDQLVLAALHRRAGERDEAEAIYERLLAGPERGVVAVAQAAAFFAETGRFERGLQLLLGLDERVPGRALLVGSFQRRHGSLDEAAAWLRLAIERGSGSAEAYNELARVHLDRGDREAARAVAERGLEAWPDHLALRGTLALSHLGDDSTGLGAAVSMLRGAASDHPDLEALFRLLGRIPTDENRPPDDALLADARKLLERHGSIPATWNLVVRLHLRAGQAEEAVELARRAVGRFPAQPEPSEWATRLLMEQGRWHEALVEAEEWRRRSRHDPLRPDVVIARVLLELDRAADAIGQLEAHGRQIERQAEAHPERLRVWVRAQLEGGRSGAVERLISPRLEDERWRRWWLGLVDDLGDDAAAAALARLAPRPGGVDHLVLASAWLRLAARSGREAFYREAERLAGEAEAQGADTASVWMLRGSVAEGLDDLAGAERLYRRVLARRGDDVAALNNLAYILVRRENYESARPLVERALALAPGAPDVLDTWAQVLRGLGRLDEAEQALLESLEQRPDDPTLRLSLVQVQIDQGRREPAALNLEKARRALDSARRPRADDLRRVDELRQRLGALSLGE